MRRSQKRLPSSFASCEAKVISLEKRSIFGWNLRRPGILQHAFSTQPKSCGRWSSSTYSMAVHAATMSVLMRKTTCMPPFNHSLDAASVSLAVQKSKSEGTHR